MKMHGQYKYFRLYLRISQVKVIGSTWLVEGIMNLDVVFLQCKKWFFRC
jgi:hypothetical protein